MDIPKKLFATARAFEEGGSLTIVGTALIDTGSRMDELIFQEFKGTGNMELVLDRKLADRRVWPAIDIEQSGTRREEKLLPPETLHAVTMLRRTLSTMHHVDAMEQLTTQARQVQVERRVHQADPADATREILTPTVHRQMGHSQCRRRHLPPHSTAIPCTTSGRSP